MCEDEDSSSISTSLLATVALISLGALFTCEGPSSQEQIIQDSVFQVQRNILAKRDEQLKAGKLYEGYVPTNKSIANIVAKDTTKKDTTPSPVVKKETPPGKDAKSEVFKTLSDNCQLYNKQTVLESSRIMGVNPSTIHLLCLSSNNGKYQNIYDYQQVTLKTASTPTQNNIINLVTQQTLPITPGLSYKVFYHKLKEGSTLTEEGFYRYAATRANAKSDIMQNNNLLYNRKLSDISGIIDSVKLAK